MTYDIAEQIADELHITNEDFEKRKAFLDIGDEDIQRIKAFRRRIPEIPKELFDMFYNHLMSFDETRVFFKDSDVLLRLKNKQLYYFDRLFSGEYDREYMLSRLHVGYIHVKLNVVPLWYIGAYNKYLQGIRKLVDDYCEDKTETLKSILKVIMLEIVITLESFHYVKYRLQEELKQVATTDDLTGVFNRRKLEEVMNYEMDLAKRRKLPLSILMIDIDHFKNVNDTHGHQTGDAVLVSITQLIKSSLRNSDYVIRYGGEEFLICLPNTPCDRAVIIAERCRKTIAAHQFNTVGHVTVSIGIAQFDFGEGQDTYIKRVDQKLYEAKRTGRNKICF